MGGQLDGIFLAGSLPHEFIILIVTLFICLWLINFFSLSRLLRPGAFAPSPVYPLSYATGKLSLSSEYLHTQTVLISVLLFLSRQWAYARPR